MPISTSSTTKTSIPPLTSLKIKVRAPLQNSIAVGHQNENTLNYFWKHISNIYFRNIQDEHHRIQYWLNSISTIPSPQNQRLYYNYHSKKLIQDLLPQSYLENQENQNVLLHILIAQFDLFENKNLGK